ncbi:MAG: hypothetical protein J6I73_07830 [Treponema sp.]|nr:hypothetical protein [Treponema sp.]
MASKGKSSIGSLLLQIALGLFFVVTGIWTLQNGTGNEIATAINKLFSGDLQRIIRLVFGIIEVLAGAFLLLRMFVSFSSSIDSLLMVIVMIAWLVSIVLLDVIGGFALSMNWLHKVAYHLLVLGGIIMVKD